MARFSSVFGLSNAQANLDFVDVELSTDTPLYLDPYAIQIREDEWSNACGDHLRSFFQELMDRLRAEDAVRVRHLLSHLHEPNETRFGVSSGVSRGRGFGQRKAELLTDALQKSRAFQTGLLTDISEVELFIYGVGRDMISDLTTNVVRGLLVKYTGDQCRLHNIPMRSIGGIGPVWNLQRRNWEAVPTDLPVYEGRPVLLVPKFSVRHRLSLDSQEFWNHHMIEFLKEEHLQAGSALVHTLKDGRRKVYKSEVKERHPFVKDDLADFVRNHPEILEIYKNIKGARGPLSAEELEESFDERAFAGALLQRLVQIPSGGTTASQYHSFCMGVCTFLFYPSLICPVKEHEIHEGRKRIDIKFTNAAERGFFRTMLEANQTRSISVFIECKNYTKEINNPELDQLSGRFGHTRGFFGMVFCRKMEDRQRIIARCRDTATDQRGFIIVLEDADLDILLQAVANGNWTVIDQFLQQRFDEIS